MARTFKTLPKDVLVARMQEAYKRINNQEASIAGLMQKNETLINELNDEMSSVRDDFIRARGALMRIDRLLELKPHLTLEQARKTILPLINEGMNDNGWKYDKFGNKDHW